MSLSHKGNIEKCALTKWETWRQLTETQTAPPRATLRHQRAQVPAECRLYQPPAALWCSAQAVCCKGDFASPSERKELSLGAWLPSTWKLQNPRGKFLFCMTQRPRAFQWNWVRTKFDLFCKVLHSDHGEVQTCKCQVVKP